MTKDEFDVFIKNNKRVVAYFSAPWCGPCKAMAPLLDKEISLFPDIHLVKINVDDDDTEIPKSLGIRSIPVLISYVDGVIQEKLVGGQSAANLNAFLSTKV